MIIKNEEDMPLTRGDLREFCALLCAGLDPCERGDPVPAIMIQGLHSDAPAEHDETGRTRVRLFDLYDGRTGIERDDGLIYYAD